MSGLPVNHVLCGDCVEVMRGFPEESVDMVMTSPPYWGLRNYGEATETVWGGDPDCKHEWSTNDEIVRFNKEKWKSGQRIISEKELHDFRKRGDKSCLKCGAWRGQLGLEPTWQMYVEHMVSICRQIKRVLKRTGNMYLVLGDTYAASRSYQVPQTKWKSSDPQIVKDSRKTSGYQPKCLMGMPWRVAFALIDDGWILRERIVWHKDNPMPGSQRDRLTQTCEVIFHFVKNTGKRLLWRNELTGEWLKKRPKQVYFHVETHELREDRPSKEEKYVVDEFGSRRLVWKPLWRGFDYYYELDAIREAPVSLHPSGNKARKIPHRPKGGRLGHSIPWSPDVFQSKKEPYIGNNPHRMRLEKQRFLALDPSRPMDLSHPKGKNPGDVLKLDSVACPSGPQRWEREGTNRVEARFHPDGKNPDDFWSICTKPFKGAHFAVYPEAICVRPIKSSCPPDGVVLDPMCGIGTTCRAAKKLARKFIGIDINPAYVEMAKKLLSAVSERLDAFAGFEPATR